MNTAIILILGIPLVEIYLFIKIGSQIGALNTILLILFTAVLGIWYARYEGFNTLRSGMSQLVRNELPLYEIISGAAIAFAALLLILPGFATDVIGILLVFPLTRKIILSKYSKKNSSKRNLNEKNYIDGEYEDIDDANALHYTLGGAWYDEPYESKLNDIWLNYKEKLNG